MRTWSATLLTLAALAAAGCGEPVGSPAAAAAKPPIHTEVVGSEGAWLVLVHGGLGDRSTWDPTVAELCGEFRCLLMDLRGHGASADVLGPYDMPTMGNDVALAMRYHGVDDALIVGHSMGVRVALEAALIGDDRTRGVVFLDGARLAEGDAAAARRAVRARIDEVGVDALFGVILASHFSEEIDADLKAESLERWMTTARAIGRELMGNLFYYDAGAFPDRAQQLSVPCLAVATTTTELGGRARRNLRDDETTTPYLEFVRSVIPQSETVVIPNSGHFVQYESPDALNDMLRRFAREVAALPKSRRTISSVRAYPESALADSNPPMVHETVSPGQERHALSAASVESIRLIPATDAVIASGR